MTPAEILIWGRAFKLGVAAERDRIRGLLAQADAIADELVALRTEVHRLEVLASAAPSALVDALTASRSEPPGARWARPRQPSRTSHR